MPAKTLDTLFHETLRDIYYADMPKKKLLTALKKLARGASDLDLKQAFTSHRDETGTHIEPLRQVFDMIGKSCVR